MTAGNVTAGKESVFGTMEEVTFSREGRAGSGAETFGPGRGLATPLGIAASGGYGRAGQACSRDWCSAIARRRSFVSAQALLSGFGNGGRSLPRGHPRQRWRKTATRGGGCT
jgi:hypothetical protein